MKERDDMDLDSLLAEAAKAPRPMAEEAFMARILADAERLQPPAPGFSPVRRPAPAARPAGWLPAGLGVLADVFGGRAALAGMMAATVAGLFLGMAQPSALSGVASAFYGTQTPLSSLDLMAGSDSLWTETLQ